MIDTVLGLPVSLAVCAAALAYTPPNSKLRLLATVIIACGNYIAAQSTVAKSFPGYIAPEYLLGWVLCSSNWLNLARVHYKPPAKGYEKANAREKWALYHIFDTRWSVHPSGIPFFDKDRPQWTPSKRYFLLWKLWTITWCTALWYGLDKFEPLTIEDLLDIPTGFLYRLDEMSSREVWLRIYIGFQVMATAYATLCLMHAVCGFIAVAVFNDDPAGWRPLHGSPLAALGMRGYYKSFWHHCMRKGFTSHAVWLINDVLRLPRKNSVSRYLIVILTFWISGLYHALLTPDFPWQCSMKQINYQNKVIIAILCEDIVAMLWTRYAPRNLRLDIGNEEHGSSSMNDANTTSLAKANGKTELRRRNGVLKEYPSSPMPMTPTKGAMKSSTSESINWTSIVLRGIIYTYTICFLIWANSILVWDTSKCIVSHRVSVEDMTAYFQQRGFSEPI